MSFPAWNERDGIEKTIRAIPKSELENTGYEVQTLVVDGGSDEAGAEVIVEPRRGYGRVCQTGFPYAKGDIIVNATD